MGLDWVNYLLEQQKANYLHACIIFLVMNEMMRLNQHMKIKLKPQVILYSGEPFSDHVTSRWDGLSQYLCKKLFEFI